MIIKTNNLIGSSTQKLLNFSIPKGMR